MRVRVPSDDKYRYEYESALNHSICRNRDRKYEYEQEIPGPVLRDDKCVCGGTSQSPHQCIHRKVRASDSTSIETVWHPGAG